jgi:hypothetical protein
MVRTQIQLNERQARQLKLRAADEGISVAELIRRSIDSYLATTSTIDREELHRRAMAAAGRFDGPGDLAVEHDRYLAEAYET